MLSSMTTGSRFGSLMIGNVARIDHLLVTDEAGASQASMIASMATRASTATVVSSGPLGRTTLPTTLLLRGFLAGAMLVIGDAMAPCETEGSGKDTRGGTADTTAGTTVGAIGNRTMGGWIGSVAPAMAAATIRTREYGTWKGRVMATKGAKDRAGQTLPRRICLQLRCNKCSRRCSR